MLLEACNLHIAYGDIQAVTGVSFCVEQGELISIIGANGAGKTSILSSIMGLTAVKSGNILYKDREITTLPAYQRARSGIRIVPERARVFPRLTVYENLMTGVYSLHKTINVDDQITWLYDLFSILKERKTVSLKHVKYQCQFYGEKQGIIRSRKSIPKYFSAMMNNTQFKSDILKISTYDQMKNLIENIYESHGMITYR